jgi:hypothetical protein
MIDHSIVDFELIKILVVLEPNVLPQEQEEGYTFDYLLDTVRNWRGFGYRFDVQVHVHQEDSIKPELIESADELWFFGTELCDGSKPVVVLTDNEVNAIRARMDAGVGIFATGDHQAIGSGLCMRLPRAANMRVWSGEGAPEQDSPFSFNSSVRSSNRDIVERGRSIDCETDDRDTLPKQIWPVHLPDGTPHELMQLPLPGEEKQNIRFFPDHMHEGKLYDFVREPKNDELAELLKAYYPGTMPYIVARSVRAVFDQNKGPSDCVSYPVVSVYEPPSTSTWGNIVVDSTFHHWTDQNSLRVRYSPAGFHVEQYAINVANWLLGSQGRKKVKNATERFIRKNFKKGDHIFGLLGSGKSDEAFRELASYVGYRMAAQRIVGDALERILLDGVVSSDPGKVQELVEDVFGLKNERLETFSIADRQRVVLGLAFEQLTNAFAGK